MEIPKEVLEFEVYAWVGQDEHGSGVFGLKQGLAPAGIIPMVSTDQQKLDQYWKQAEGQAEVYGMRIYLVKLTCTEVLRGTRNGE
jgi:hypothetical protein